MCGISAIIDKTKSLDEPPIQQMNNALVHRGPDANGWVKLECPNQHIFLGHTRLSIIDAENPAANQPMLSSNQRFWLVYNGEIYNYRELRNELEVLGVVFNSQSDTEVLIEGLAFFGREFLDKVNGMYAFVCWDSEKQEIIAARDPSGMKPLYIYENESYTIFSSSVNGILKSGLVEADFNIHALEPYLRFKFAPSPDTFYSKIISIPAFEVRTKTYRFGGVNHSTILSKSDTIRQTEGLLKKSLERHLISDKSVGLFLSGGVDSTLILSLLQEMGHEKFPVFTIGKFLRDSSNSEIPSPVTQDSKYAKLAAKQFGGELVELHLGDEILMEFDQMVSAMDQPIADPAALLTYIISREAKRSVSVALSGAGADEVFAGYNRHQAFYSYLTFGKYLPRWISSGMAHFLNALNNSAVSFNNGTAQKLTHFEKFFRDISTDPGTTFQNFTSLGFFSPLHGGHKFPKSTIETDLNVALAMDRTDFLAQDILAITDQMSMAHSLEVRLPYLDRDLLNFIDQLPASYLLKYERKWLLNEILLKKNGRPFVERKKEGFGMPLGNWLRRSKNAFFFESLLDPENLIFEWIDFANTQHIIQKHLSKNGDFSREIWALAVFEKWFQQNQFSR